MFVFGKPRRTPPHNDADKISLFNSMAAYTGIARRNDDKLITMVDFSHDPTFGGEQTRFFKLDGDRLIIRTPPQIFIFSQGRQSVGILEWIREPGVSITSRSANA